MGQFTVRNCYFSGEAGAGGCTGFGKNDATKSTTGVMNSGSPR